MSWITVTGENDRVLEEELSNHSQARIRESGLSKKEIDHITGLKASVRKGPLKVNDEVLEKLRTLCMSWDIDLKPREITSHRKILGPFIVAVKRLFYPVLRAFLSDTLAAQRHFNGTAISLLAELSSQRDQKDNKGGGA